MLRTTTTTMFVWLDLDNAISLCWGWQAAISDVSSAGQCHDSTNSKVLGLAAVYATKCWREAGTLCSRSNQSKT